MTLSSSMLLAGPRGRRLLLEYALESERVAGLDEHDGSLAELEFFASYRLDPHKGSGALRVVGPGDSTPKIPAITPAQVAARLETVPLADVTQAVTHGFGCGEDVGAVGDGCLTALVGSLYPKAIATSRPQKFQQATGVAASGSHAHASTEWPGLSGIQIDELLQDIHAPPNEVAAIRKARIDRHLVWWECRAKALVQMLRAACCECPTKKQRDRC